MDLPLYLDYNATTPADEAVVEAMLPWLRDRFGNPSSRGHAYGWMADEAVAEARSRVAHLFQTEADAVTFTGGATEALNLAIKGVARARRRRGAHLVTVATEHSAVLDSHAALHRDGFEVTYLKVDRHGLVALEDVRSALRDDTTLLSVMWANNETGVIQPIRQIYEVAHERGVVFLTDATQAAGKVPVDASAADFLTCSAHKFYGPKGVGALIRNPNARRLRLVPLIDGGGQETGLRAGTLNVPAIVGMGKAAEIAIAQLEEDHRRLSRLRNRFEDALSTADARVRINGREAERLPQTSSITFQGVPSSKLIPLIRELAVSTGSACASGSGRPSHVLKAMGLSDEDAMSTIRFSFGRPTTETDVDRAVDIVLHAVAEVVRQ